MISNARVIDCVTLLRQVNLTFGLMKCIWQMLVMAMRKENLHVGC